MIISFYDKNFTALQNNASLNVGTWSLKRKAVDLDDFTATSEPFLENVNPTFVVLADDRGKYKYGAFAGVPELNDDNQTSIQATDLKSIFKNQIFIKFDTYSSVKDLFEHVFSIFDEQVIQKSFTIDYDLSDIESIMLDTLKPSTEEYQTINIWEDLLVDYMKYYDLYMSSKIDLANKQLYFKISRINKFEKPLRLYDFGIKNYGKWVSSLNECQTVVLTDTNIIYGTQYILLSDNSITSNIDNRDLYPIKKELIVKEASSNDDVETLLVEGAAECVEKLAGNRFNEGINIQVNNTPYQDDDFETLYSIYTQRGEFYKKLPIGIIEENNEGTKTLTIGYKDDDIVLYI